MMLLLLLLIYGVVVQMAYSLTYTVDSTSGDFITLTSNTGSTIAEYRKISQW